MSLIKLEEKMGHPNLTTNNMIAYNCKHYNRSFLPCHTRPAIHAAMDLHNIRERVAGRLSSVADLE
jgi:hypothetical protein